MTWLKLSDDFADKAARSGLSDAAFRTHIEALLWTMRRESGGWIRERDILRFAETRNPEAAVQELVGKGWWHYPFIDPRYPAGDEDRDAGAEPGLFRIVANMDDQPEPDVIEARRRKTAERVRRHRRKMAGLDTEDPPGNAVTERVTRARGRDGSGPTDPPVPKGQNQGAGQDGVGDPIADKTGSGLHRSAANSHKPRVHDGPDHDGPDDQHIADVVHLQSPAAGRNAREPTP